MAIKSKNTAPEDPEVDVEVEEEEADGDDGETEQNESEEDKVAREEREASLKRRKELKAMPVDDVKAMALGKGLETGKKEEMIDGLLLREAADRAEERRKQAMVREVVLRKKQDLEEMNMQELKKLCGRYGVMDAEMKKPARVEILMKKWQEDDGIDKALAKVARDRREQDLRTMQDDDLRRLCESVGIDPYVKEVMVERIVQREREQGRFLRPMLNTDGGVSQAKSSTDVVDSLVASEALRKQEKERERQRAEAKEQRLTELRSLTVDELKKQLLSRKQDATGKKDDLIAALFALKTREDAVSARKSELKALGLDQLRSLALSKGLEAGKKDAMVDALCAHEAKVQESITHFEEKLREVFRKKKEEFEAKTTAELKELCASRSLKPGVGKDAHVERLLADVKASGEMDQVVAVMNRQARQQELSSMDTAVLVSLCTSLDAVPTVKEVMVERAMAHEQEFGHIADPLEPKKKKARTSMK